MERVLSQKILPTIKIASSVLLLLHLSLYQYFHRNLNLTILKIFLPSLYILGHNMLSRNGKIKDIVGLKSMTYIYFHIFFFNR